MSPFMPNEYAVKATTFYQRGAMLAPIRLTNAAAQLVLRPQVRRKETHPHPSLLLPRPYAVLLGRVAHQYQIAVMPPSEAQAAPVT